MNAFIIALISISLQKHLLGAKIFNLDLATFHLNAEFRVQGDGRALLICPESAEFNFVICKHSKNSSKWHRVLKI